MGLIALAQILFKFVFFANSEAFSILSMQTGVNVPVIAVDWLMVKENKRRNKNCDIKGGTTKND